MVTDTKRILRTDPGRPEVCNVCQLHRFFGADYEEIWDGERTARTGCVDTKKLLADRIVAHYAPARERYLELLANPAEVDGILEAGADRLRPMADGHDGRGPREDGSSLTAMLSVPARRAATAGWSARCSCSGWSALFFIVVGQLAAAFFFFGDIFLTFFLAWLLAFIISPIVGRLMAIDPAPAARRRRRSSSTPLVVVGLGPRRGRRPRAPWRRRSPQFVGIDPGHPGQPADDRARRGRTG